MGSSRSETLLIFAQDIMVAPISLDDFLNRPKSVQELCTQSLHEISTTNKKAPRPRLEKTEDSWLSLDVDSIADRPLSSQWRDDDAATVAEPVLRPIKRRSAPSRMERQHHKPKRVSNNRRPSWLPTINESKASNSNNKNRRPTRRLSLASLLKQI